MLKKCNYLENDILATCEFCTTQEGMSRKPIENRGEIIIYRAEDNTVQLDVHMENETVWLTQKQMADLFGVKKAAISKHVSNIFSQGELSPDMTVSKMETVVNRGFRGMVLDMVDYYNLDMILSIGYRVNSKRAIAFRQWQTKSTAGINSSPVETKSDFCYQ